MTTFKGSRTAKVRKLIGNDYYDLKLCFDQLVELQEETGRGPLYIANQLARFDMETGKMFGDFSPKWIYHTVRLGLIGSEEMKPTEAVRFCDRHLRDGFIMDYVEAAVATIEAAMYGNAEDPVPDLDEGDSEGNATTDQTTPSNSVKSDGADISDWREPSA